MIKLYIGSFSPHSGKTLVAMTIGTILREKGLQVGYLKPLGNDPLRIKGRAVDPDIVMAQKVIGLKDAYEHMSAGVLDYETVSTALKRKKDLLKDINVYIKRFMKRDIVLIEGLANIFDGSIVSAGGLQTVKRTGAKVLLVEPWRGDGSIDIILGASEIFGKAFAGTVLNKVPSSETDYVKKDVKGFLKKNNIPLFAAFGKDPVLGTVTVGDLKEVLNGKVLCCEDRMDQRVENYLVGAMDVSNAIKYFRRTPNKAVITGGHRSDIQLAALETSTRCLILTGGVYANDVIIGKAETMGVPVLSVKLDTFSAIDRIESILGKTRSRDDAQVKRVSSRMGKKFDWKLFSATVGL